MHRDHLQKLKAASSLAVVATGGDAYRAEQIQAAIEFLRREQESPHPAAKPDDYDRTIAKLIAFSTSETPNCGFSHLDLQARAYEPLFLRAQVIREMKRLAGKEEAVLLVTGLREALAGKGRYWTKRLQERHREAIDFIERIALCFKTTSTRLNIVFV